MCIYLCTSREQKQEIFNIFHRIFPSWVWQCCLLQISASHFVFHLLFNCCILLNAKKPQQQLAVTILYHWPLAGLLSISHWKPCIGHSLMQTLTLMMASPWTKTYNNCPSSSATTVTAVVLWWRCPCLCCVSEDWSAAKYVTKVGLNKSMHSGGEMN